MCRIAHSNDGNGNDERLFLGYGLKRAFSDKTKEQSGMTWIKHKQPPHHEPAFVASCW